jgi:lipoprotein signal peptidase
MTRMLHKFSCLYLGLAILAVVADVLVWKTTEYGDQTESCNFYDAMLVAIECRDVVGSNTLELFLNWPLTFYYGAIFSLFSVEALIFTILIWSPIVFLLWTCVRRKFQLIVKFQNLNS